MSVVSALVIIGTEKNAVVGILLNYNDDDYSQGCGQIKEAFLALTKDDILQPYKTDHDYRSSDDDDDDDDDLGYNIHVCSIKYCVRSMIRSRIQIR